jgi:hypothetical protein
MLTELISHLDKTKDYHRIYREHTEWRFSYLWRSSPHDGKSTLAGEGGRCTPTPFHLITITYKVAVYPAERAVAILLQISTLCVICDCIIIEMIL